MAVGPRAEQMTQPSSPAARADTVRVVGILMMVQSLGSMSGLWLPSIAPAVAADIGIDASMIGYQVLTMYIGAMTTSLMAGGMIARYGPWRTTQISAVLFGLGQLSIATAWIPTMALGSLVIGFGYGLVNPPASHLLAQVTTPKNRNFVFSIRYTGMPIGGVLAGLIAPSAALAIGWRTSLFITIAFAFFCVIVMQPWRARWDHDRNRDARVWRNPLSDVVIAWRHPPLRWICFLGFLFAGIQISLTSFTVTMLVEDVGYTLVAAGIALSCIQVAGVIGRVSWGAIADRFQAGFMVLAVIGAISFVCAMLAVTLSDAWSTILVYVLFFVFGFAAMGWNGVCMGEVARLSRPGLAGNMTGAVLFFTFSGVVGGPVAFAAAHAVTGRYTTTFILTGGLALLGVGAILIGRAKAKQFGTETLPT